MTASLPSELREIQQTATRVALDVLSSEAPGVDRDAAWPKRSLAAIAATDLLGLHVPRRLGGREEGMLALVVATEALARECPSTALCYGMHCVATAVLAAKATPQHEAKYLRPIAAGQHFTTIALSEAGTGVHFYWPETHLRRDGDILVANGQKVFVTSGGFADSYVVTTTSAAPDSGDVGEFSALVLDADTPGIQWSGDWDGFGMRGNSARAMQLSDVRVPVAQLLGQVGDEVWYVFEVIAPYFLMAMSGVYLGIAAGAADLAQDDVRARQHAHTGRNLAAEPVVQHRVAELWIELQQARHVVYEAARLADAGDPSALPLLFASKAAASSAAVTVTNAAMDLGGGRAYHASGRLSRMLRDARAGHVMSPTTDMLKTWLGRSLLGEPLL